MSRAASLRVLASPAQLRAVPWPPRIFSQADSPISSLPQLRQTSSQLGCRSEAVAYHSACSRTLSRNPHRPAILRVSAPMAPAQSTAAVQAQVAQSPADAAAAPPTEKPDVSASKDVPRQQLRKLEELTWENTFVEETPGDTNTENNVRIVRNACYSLVRPSLNLNDPQLIAASASVARDCLGLDPQEFERPEFVAIFSGGVVPQGCKPYAQCYGGHQFGSWAGQLGDGRAITLGEVVPAPVEGADASSSGAGGGEGSAERWEIQLKGVGQTPYSRRADGRAVLRSSIREFLCSEAMHALGVPTTRALSIVATGEKVLRDMFYNGNAKFEPGAAVCRVAPSLLRFGSFQLPVSRGGLEKELARRLADYAIQHHFKHLAHLPEPPLPEEKEATSKGGAGGEGDGEGEDPDSVDATKNKYTAWFAEVAERTGRLVAGWQGVGFTHGVLNTDNMSILGLTIDYGPFGFLDNFDPRYTPNTTDLPGRRYCFQNQPDIGLWNIVQLANALHTGGLVSVAEAQFCVSRYADTFVQEYERTMAAKMGLKAYDKTLTQDLLQLMAKHEADFTNTFRTLASVPLGGDGRGVPGDDQILQPLEGVLGLDASSGAEGVPEKRQEWAALLQRLVAKVREEHGGTVSSEEEAQRRAAMDRVNPKYILRNYLCQKAIEAAEGGDYGPTQRLAAVLSRPYDHQEGADDLCQPAPEWAKKPGVCMLSCSS